MEAKLPDPRNADTLVHVGGKIVPRNEAKVSVFDSSVQGGDAVWEGLRIYNGRIFKLDAHIDRMLDSAKAMAFAEIPTRDQIKVAIFETLKANGMRDSAHIRLTLTRGMKTTSNMDPKVNQYGPCLIVLAEWKPPRFSSSGIRLITSAIRRNTPQCVDSKIHQNNYLNNILAKIEWLQAGCVEALMLNHKGEVAECTGDNIFLVSRGQLLTPPIDAGILEGITRNVVIELAGEAGLAVHEVPLSKHDVYIADECFLTGSAAEVIPVVKLDSRPIGNGKPGPITRHLNEAFRKLVRES